jgi:patatin-like phospholipase/acyl hydrolase
MFRILSLDGGGLMRAFTASVLATLERSTKFRMVDHFDLITGTSTGGIIAIGLGMGHRPRGSSASTRSKERPSSRRPRGSAAGSKR